MPELPEVHTISSDLRKHILDAVISDIKITDSYKTHPDNNTFIKEVKNKKIINVDRVAKNIVFVLENQRFLIFHLAMTGQILLRVKEFKPDRWVRVVLNLTKNSKQGELRFTDMRMFGKVKILNQNEYEDLNKKYGFDPTKESVEPKDFLESLKTKRTTIKNALLDQKIISGVGNIYATDSLWMSAIHPEIKTTNITLSQAKSLLENIRTILKESIEHRGSTLEDKMYVDIFGKQGEHQNFFRIYNKKTCPNCNAKTSFKKINGRGTFFCSNCQKI